MNPTRGGTLRVMSMLTMLAGLAWLSPATAEDEPLPDRLKLELGGYFLTEIDTVAELNREVGPILVGGRVDFNQQLGLGDRKNVFRLDGYYRFGRRHSLDFSYWDIRRDATTFVGTEIEFGEITIPAGEEVYSYFNTRTLRASYAYSLYNVPKAEIVMTFGLHITNFDLGVNCQSCAVEQVETAEFPAPLPVLGFKFRYQISRRWRLAGYSQHFLLDFGGFSGSMSDTRVSFMHHTFKNVGFGVGWNRIVTDMEIDTSDYLGAVETALDGLQGYVVLSFGKAHYPAE